MCAVRPTCNSTVTCALLSNLQHTYATHASAVSCRWLEPWPTKVGGGATPFLAVSFVSYTDCTSSNEMILAWVEIDCGVELCPIAPAAMATAAVVPMPTDPAFYIKGTPSKFHVATRSSYILNRANLHWRYIFPNTTSPGNWRVYSTVRYF